jgi:hypothetical protein
MAVVSFEMFVYVYQITQCHIPEDSNLVWHGSGPVSMGGLRESDKDLSGPMDILEQMRNYQQFKKYIAPCK